MSTPILGLTQIVFVENAGWLNTATNVGPWSMPFVLLVTVFLFEQVWFRLEEENLPNRKFVD